MSITGLAGKCGVTSSSLQELINGKVKVGISGKLGVTGSSLQTFLNGGTSIGLASKIGITSSNLQELRNQIGEQGAIGIIIGLLLKENH